MVVRACVAGQRFKYTYYNKIHGDIWQSIEQLDRAVRLLYARRRPIKSRLLKNL